ncbi:MAG: glycosyltransferase family 4 protein [Bacteroidales bacterium]|nr:glycosyltransferase family 4 protein [Bacteroidales bacterium]
MRILIITNKLPYPPKDGGAIATFSLAENLSEIVEKIDVVAINTSKHYFDIKNIPADFTEKISFFDFFLNTDIKVLKLLVNFLFSSLPYNAERFINKGFEDKIIELLSINKYDVVQFEGLYVLSYLKTVRKFSNALISYRSHNIEHEIWQRTLDQTKGFFKRFYVKILTKRLKKFELSFINSYDLIVPITNRDSEKFEEFGNKKPSLTIPTGVIIENYKSTEILPEKNSVFHIGALDWSPNQEGLLWFIDNCWPIVIAQKPEVKFYIAGRNAPKWFISKMKLQKNIVFVGEVDDAQQFINSKQIMIVPLLSGGGMRIKIIEGMALAKAIVTTSIGIEGIPANNNEQVVIEDNSEQFAQRIIELINQPQKAVEIGNSAKIFVSENFDNFAIAKKLYGFYDNRLKINK